MFERIRNKLRMRKKTQASLAGAKFAVYAKGSDEALIVVTGEDGMAKLPDLRCGDYIVEELEAPPKIWQVADTDGRWTLNDFPVKEIVNEMISAYDTGNKSTVYLVGDTGATVRFQAHIYEPAWEAFSVTCDIDCLENGEYKGLYRCWSVNESNYHNVVKTSGSCEAAEKYIRQKMPNGFYLKYSLN